MDWFRWHTGSTTDPKFRVVAKRAAQAVPGVRLSDVLAVWAMLLERASEASERGMIDGYDCEGADAHLDLPDGSACAIVQAMRDKGLITPERVAKWDQRQPKREDTTATERKRAQRERERENKADVTHGHEMSHTVTHGHDRGEEIRGEESKNTHTPSSDDKTARAGSPTTQPGESGGGENFTSVPYEASPWAIVGEIQQIGEGYPNPDRYDPGPSEVAMKALSARRQWPGMNVVMRDIAARSKTDDWTREGGRFVPYLSRYIRDRTWLNKIPEGKAAPSATAYASPESKAVDEIAEKLRRKEAANHERTELPESHHGERVGGPATAGAALPEVQTGRQPRPPGP
jgi:hypothetical protein